MSQPRREGKQGFDLVAILARPLNLKEPQLKFTRQILGVVLLGVLAIVGVNLLTPGPKTGPKSVSSVVEKVGPKEEAVPRDDLTRVRQDMEARLSALLSQVEGAGRAEVFLSLEVGPEQVPSANTQKVSKKVEEKDNSGGTRVTTEITESAQPVLARPAGGAEGPIVQKVLASRFSGVLVVADGARYPAIREQLTRALEAALGVPANRIQVIARKAGGS